MSSLDGILPAKTVGWRLEMGKKQSTIKQSASLWEWLNISLLDPVVFAFILFIIFDRIKTLMDYSTIHPEYNLYQLLNQDIAVNAIYIVFAIVFGFWIVGKAIQYKNKLKESGMLIDTLDSINGQLKKLNTKMSTIEKKIGRK